MPLVEPHLKSGRARAVAVFDTRRSPLLPNVPAVSEEVNVPGYTPTPVWYGFVAPAKTPRDVVAALSEMIRSAMLTSEVKARLLALGAQQIDVGGEQFAADIKVEYDKAGLLAKKLGTFK